MTLKRGQDLGRLPRMSYAALASAISALRSTLLPQATLDELRKSDLTGARSILESTSYREVARATARSAEELYAAVKRSVLGSETRVLSYAPKRARSYLSSYLLHWDAEELKRELALRAMSRDPPALRSYVESLPNPWSAVRSSLEAFEKSHDPIDLTLQVDRIYIEQLVSSFNALADCERYELSGFIFPTLAWYVVKTQVIGKEYGKQLDIGISSSKELQKSFLSAIEQRTYPESVAMGEEKYARLILEWARNQAHRNQFSPAPAQAAFILKETEAKEISEILLEKLYGVRSKA
ncbi:V-type ATPase subunit [Tardisphaera miroshnichenkoae]